MKWRRLELWRCAKVGARVEVLGDLYVVGRGRVELGDDVRLDGRAAAIELRTGPGGVLKLGDGCVLHHGVSLEAEERVELGPRCELHAFAKVMDNHFHPVHGDRLSRPASKPVTLGEGVVLGPRSIVLPGAQLEDGVALGPGVVISRRVRAHTALSGAPPRVVPRGSLQFDLEAEPPRASPRRTLGALTTMGREELAGHLPTAERLLRVLDVARGRARLRGFTLGRRVFVRGELEVQREGNASVGDGTMFLGGPVPSALRVRRGGELRIGEGCQINYGVTFDATTAVRVGARCMFGSYARLVDDARPIVLEDDVWVAHGAVILPGVTIGRGAVVAAGAVVTADVPAGMLALGNPARVMSQALSGS